jgi:4'-phosphopantetheinyl transferase
LPDFWFSFSACSIGFIGAWSSTHAIGVDLEDQTKDMETTELARQFFSTTEANAVEAASGLERLRTFFQFWCLKEAALKSIGEGLPFGLDAFEFELGPDLRVVRVPQGHGGVKQFDAHILEGSDSCAALIIRSLA